MKKFLIKTSIFIALVISIICCSLFVFLRFIPVPTDVYDYSHTMKMRRLDTLPSPRIIFVGGSNVAFGLNSGRIADSLDVNVQNTGVIAGIGLRYMLDEVNARLRKGDVVVVMPEYAQFESQYNGNDMGTLTDAVVYNNFSGWSRLNAEQKMNVISGLPILLKNHIFNYDRAVKEGIHYVYSSRNFNEYGDECSHWNITPPKLEVKSYAQHGIIEEYFKEVAEKVGEMKSKGAKVIFVPPAAIEMEYNSKRKIINDVDRTLRRYGIPFAVPPAYLMEPDSCAFDTPYHMNGAGVEDVTGKIIRLLRRSPELFAN